MCKAADPATDTIKVDLNFCDGKVDGDPESKADGVAAMPDKGAFQKDAALPHAVSAWSLTPVPQPAACALVPGPCGELAAATSLHEEDREAAAARLLEEREREEREERASQRREREAELRRQRVEAACRRADQEEAARNEREFHERQRLEDRRAALLKENEQEEADRRLMEAFLLAHDFKNATSRKRRFTWSSLPLHTAVAQNDAQMVSILLRHGADASAKVSGQTALEFARRLAQKASNSPGMYSKVLATLGSDGI